MDDQPIPQEKRLTVDGLMKVIDVLTIEKDGKISTLRVALELQKHVASESIPKNYVVRWSQIDEIQMPEVPKIDQYVSVSAVYYQLVGSPGMITRLDKWSLQDVSTVD